MELDLLQPMFVMLTDGWKMFTIGFSKTDKQCGMQISHHMKHEIQNWLIFDMDSIRTLIGN